MKKRILSTLITLSMLLNGVTAIKADTQTPLTREDMEQLLIEDAAQSGVELYQAQQPYEFDPHATQEPYSNEATVHQETVLEDIEFEDGNENLIVEPGGISTFSTSTSDYDALWRSLFTDHFGNDYLAPYTSRASKNIEGNTNRLVIEETDLTLPGKNGLDVVIKRKHDNQYYNKIDSIYLHNSTQEQIMERWAVGYTNDDTNENLYILFRTEDDFYMYMNEGITISSLPAAFETDEDYYYNNKIVYCYEFEEVYHNRSDTGIHLSYNQQMPAQTDFTTRKSAAEVVDRKLLPKKNYLGFGWDLILPEAYLYRYIKETYNYDTADEYYNEYIGSFRDIDGTVYSFDGDSWFEEYDNGTLTYTSSFDDPDNNHLTFTGYYADQTMTSDSRKYNFKIYDNRGLTYYFYNTGLATGENPIHQNMFIVAVQDEYGNTIKYDYDSTYTNLTQITDTYGRTIAFQSSGGTTTLSYQDENGVTQTICYETQTLDPSILQNDSPLEGKSVLRFTVTNAAGEKTIYDSRMTKPLIWKSDAAYGNMHVIPGTDLDNPVFDTATAYNIEQITYPTGAKTHYQYQRVRSYNDDANVSRYVYAVAESYDMVNNTRSNHKTYTLENTDGIITVAKADTERGLTTTDTYNTDSLLTLSKSLSDVIYPTGTLHVYIKNTYNDDFQIKKQVVTNNRIITTTEYEYYSGYPNLYKSITTDNSKTEYTYHTVNSRITGIPKITTYSYLSGTDYVEDYSVETTINAKNSLEYVKTIQNDSIVAQTKYLYDTNGRVNSTMLWTAGSNSDGVLDTSDKYIQDSVTYMDTVNKTLYAESTLEITDADGNSGSDIIEVYYFNSHGYPKRKYDGNNNLTSIEYDALSRPVKYTYANGATATISYNTAGCYTLVTDAAGTQYKYAYDGLGKIQQKLVYDGTWIVLEAYTYDSAGRVSTVSNYRDTYDYVKEVYTYDELDRVTQKSVYDGNVKLYDELTAYDEDDDILTITKTTTAADSTAAATQKSYYDKFGNLIKTEVISGTTTITNTYTHDYKGNVLTETLPNGKQWTYTYDFNNNMSSKSDGTKAWGYWYDMAGRQTHSYDTYSGFTYYTYDEAGRLITTKAPFENSAKQEIKTYYDANSNVVKEMVSNNAVGSTTATYSATEYTYDEMNNLIGTVVNNGTSNEAVQYWYDNANRITAMATGLDSISLTASIPTSGSVFRYEYNTLGYLSKETDALGNYNTYITDLAGNVTEMTDKRETVTENIYGPYGILSSNVYNESSEEVYNYTYDSLGHVKQIQLSDGTNITDSVSYTYDAFGRVTQESNDGFIHAYTYDVSSNVTGYTLTKSSVLQQSIAYTYNSDNLLTSQTVGDTITTYQYNDNNNLTQKVTGNYTTNVTYNQAGLPKTYKTNYGTIPYSSYTYSYRTDGNRTSEYDSIYDVNKSYTYDGTGRLTRESVTGTINKTYAYTYDKRGNRTGETVTGSENHTYVSTYDANNRLLSKLEYTDSDSYTGVNYFYDGNGNQVRKNHVTGTGSSETISSREIFAYTVSNRLKSYTNTNTATSATYTYKATGMRDTKTVGGVTTGFVWNGNNMVAETNSSGVIQNQYHYGVDGILSATLGTTNVQYLKDAHGNVVGTVNASGLQDSYYIYDAFGNSLESDPNESNPFGYCGEYLDCESGLIYLRNRYYDTTTGRFISEDPVKDGLNWYSYCAGNPVMFVDPSGNYFIIENGRGSYTLKPDTYRTVINRVAITTQLPSSVVMNLQYSLNNIVGGNSAIYGDSFEDMNIKQIRMSHPIVDFIFKVKDWYDTATLLIEGDKIVSMDNIAFGLLDKAHVNKTNGNVNILNKIMDSTYAFIESNEYFNKTLNMNIFGAKTLHMLDYELSQSSDPEAEITKYQKKAYSYYISIGYDSLTAQGATNAFTSYLSKYNERRNIIFEEFDEYIWNCINE